jgi:DeoR family glycerol-3-phosphate regulon repressor
VILVADRLKLERTAPVRIGHISQTHVFVTDHLPSTRLREVCASHGVQVIEAGPGAGENGVAAG